MCVQCRGGAHAPVHPFEYDVCSVRASACCAGALMGGALAQARVTTPVPVSPRGMQVQQTDVAAGGGRTAVLMAGYVSPARRSRDWSLRARLGGVRGLGTPVRLASGFVSAPTGRRRRRWHHCGGLDRGHRAACRRRASGPQLRTGADRVASAGTRWRGRNGERPSRGHLATGDRRPGRHCRARAPVRCGADAGRQPADVPAVTVAPNGTIVVAWLDTPSPPQPPPAPQGPLAPARILAATLATGAARFSSTAELATLSYWISGPGAASGPGGAAVTWRQTPIEQRLAPLGAGDTFQAFVPLAATGPPGNEDATFSDRLALAITAGGTNVALWLETRSGTAVVKTSTRRAGGAFSTARTLSASGWLAWPPAAMALPDRALATWTETRGRQSRVRLALHPVGRGWTALSPLPTRSLDALTLSVAASSRYAVITWIQDVGTSRTSLGGGRMYLTTYRPQA